MRVENRPDLVGGRRYDRGGQFRKAGAGDINRRMLAWVQLLVLTVAVSLGTLAEVESAEPGREEIRVWMSRGELIDLRRPAAKIFVADPAIADVQVPHADRVFVFGKKPGRTTLFALDPEGATVASYVIVVRHDDGDLQRLLRAQFGDLQVSLARTPRGAVLSGTVPSAEIAEKVRAAAALFLGETEPLVNQLRINGGLQVNLRVRVAEVSRNAVKQLGVTWQAIASTGGFTIALSNSAGKAVGSRGFNVTALVDALGQEGLVSILAEPTLTAVSGQKANFLAGGEFPIPVAQSLGNVSIEFRRFGVGLEFTPTVLSHDLISLQVRPEVSQLSTAGAVMFNGTQIPSLTVRRAETTVELGSGQSFVIGGLLQNDFNTEVDKIPGLGDVPVLGALFRSTQFRKNESELIIIVTPYIVRPIADETTIRLPTDFVGPPSDLDRLLFGQLATTKPGRGGGRPASPTSRLRGDAGFMFE
ncbi:MAG: type II and III secretion system protein family protein [Bradyrhizobium sp.]